MFVDVHANYIVVNLLVFGKTYRPTAQPPDVGAEVQILALDLPGLFLAHHVFDVGRRQPGVGPPLVRVDAPDGQAAHVRLELVKLAAVADRDVQFGQLARLDLVDQVRVDLGRRFFECFITVFLLIDRMRSDGRSRRVAYAAAVECLLVYLLAHACAVGVVAVDGLGTLLAALSLTAPALVAVVAVAVLDRVGAITMWAENGLSVPHSLY